ncbi:hypothetical protein BGZ95_000476 [Linnemannia exigua]|uniref:EH domain-containing protein n=1 Tax=Linnemannia exigua TaxID=604196 RepID=A0AAD4D8R5_9FUNG|nr:hypothetical protein BGZ95_000476 [Linnemannia exigua]
MSFLFSRSKKNVNNIHGELRLSTYERPLYDTLWKQANPQGAEHIGAVQAVEFLNLSGITPAQLAAVWDITAITDRGQDYYDRNAFDAALRLIGHAQKGLPATVALLTRESRPIFNPSNQYGAAAYYNQPPAAPMLGWPPTPPNEIKSYRDLFRNFDKENNLLKYDIVLQILLKFGLPTATLAKILALVDRQQRAALDEDEFVMAMYFSMCLRRNANITIPSTLPGEVKEICGVKSAPSPNAELNYFNVLFNNNPNSTERERELLQLLQMQQQQRDQLQEVYLTQLLENSRNSEQRLYQQQIEHNRMAQKQLLPLLTAAGLGSGRHAATFAEGYNNALKQQTELMETMIASNNPISPTPASTQVPTTTTQVPTTSTQVSADIPPAYSALQPGAFTPTSLHQQPALFTPLPAHQQPYPQYSQYQQPFQQYLPQQHQQTQPPQLYHQPLQVTQAYAQSQQYNPYVQYTPAQQAGSLQYYPPPPQGNPQYQQSSPGQPQQQPMSPGHLQQVPQPAGNQQYQSMSPGNPQHSLGQGQPFQQFQQQQSLLPGNPQQYFPPRHPQLYQQQQVDPPNASLPPNSTLLVGPPPLPSRAPQDRNDYSTITSTAVSTSAISSIPPSLPSHPSQQTGRPQETLSGRAPQYREPEPTDTHRPIGAPQLR